MEEFGAMLVDVVGMLCVDNVTVDVAFVGFCRGLRGEKRMAICL